MQLIKVIGKTTSGLILIKINPGGSFSNGVVFPTATSVGCHHPTRSVRVIIGIGLGVRIQQQV